MAWAKLQMATTQKSARRGFDVYFSINSTSNGILSDLPCSLIHRIIRPEVSENLLHSVAFCTGSRIYTTRACSNRFANETNFKAQAHSTKQEAEAMG